MKNHKSFSPRKDSSFFKLARRAHFDGGTLFIRPNKINIERYAVQINNVARSVTRNAIKREVRQSIRNITMPKLKNYDVFIIIHDWHKASKTLHTSI